MIFIIFIPFLLFAGVIEENISKIYKNIYPTIKIEKIIIKNYKNKNQQIKNIDTSNINPKKISGMIKADNHYIFYKLQAKIKVLKTTNNIGKNSTLNNSNSILTWISFKNFYAYPLTNYTNKVTKMYIPENKIIYKYMLQDKNIVLRGENINIISKSGGIEVTFQATAMQNGKKGDKIKVEKNHKFFFVTIDKNGNGRL